MNPERFKSYTPPDKSNFNKCRFFSRKEEALIEIKKLSRSSFILCLINYDFRSFFVFRALSKYAIPYGLYSYNYPVFNIKKKNIINRILNITPSTLITYLFNATPSKYLGICPASIVLALGGEYFVQRFAISKETKILWSHNFDYEIYLRLKPKPINPSIRTAVFLDQFYPFQPDEIPGVLPTPEEYYPKLCKFFDYIERKYGVHVVVAAHPRSDYDGKDDLFGKRTIIRGRTGRLVKESEFVILHNSASVNFAVLFKKAMIFITLNELPSSERTLNEFMASLFGQMPINLSEYKENSIEEELRVNGRLYDEYINRYIKKSGTDDTPAWQVFADCLKKQNAIGFQ